MKSRVGEREEIKNNTAKFKKKKQLRPWLPGTLFSELQSYKKFTNASSLASVMEELLIRTITEKKFIESLKPFMFRTITLPISPDSTYFMTIIGHPDIAKSSVDLYLKIKEGYSSRASLFVSRKIYEEYLHPLTSGLDISYDGLATIILDYGSKKMLHAISPTYQNKYHFLE